jgi:hypothetical protein
VDEESRRVAESLAAFMEEVVSEVRRAAEDGAAQVADVLAAHLGMDPRGLPVIAARMESYQLVNLDVAMAALVERHGGGEVIGLGGGDQRQHVSFGDMIQQSGRWQQFPVAAVERVDLATGPDSQRQAIGFGIHLFRFDGTPVAVLQRQANLQYGNANASLEVVAAEDPDETSTSEVAARLLAEVRQLMLERSVFRGQVLSLGGSEFTPGVGGVVFHRRPELTAADVILPPGALDRIERHVAGIARHREDLRAAGQHLKRGLLLYGPPGTGKTHTVRYLLGSLPGVTAVLLSGTSLHFVPFATELARALEPAVVVLEDCDLVAEHRDFHHGSRPLLFEVMEALDGLAEDSDIAFVLTTNRPDLLETALVQRPGRVDLAVEIPLPDRTARRALLDLYARGLPFSAACLDGVAARTAGTTASLAKELVRRVVLHAAEHGVPISDEVMETALDELLDDRERLTRSLLGAAPGPHDDSHGTG